jgi:hypothetical protein
MMPAADSNTVAPAELRTVTRTVGGGAQSWFDTFHATTVIVTGWPTL